MHSAVNLRPSWKADNHGGCRAIGRRSVLPQRQISVYLWKTPLVGLERLQTALGPLFPTTLALHSVVILEGLSGDTPIAAVDFLPQRPTDPATAMVLLTGGAVPGVIRQKSLRRLPPGCKCVGVVEESIVDAALSQLVDSRCYDTNLVLLRNDCNTFVDVLVKQQLGLEVV